MLVLLATCCLHPVRTAVVLVLLVVLGVRDRETCRGRWMLRGAVGGAVLLVAFVVTALLWNGPPRTSLLRGVKAQQARDGRLVRAARWGIVDREHVDATRRHLALARAHLRDPATRGTPLVLVAEGGTLVGSAFRMANVYRLTDPSSLDPGQIEDAARAVALQAAYDLEVEQERAPWTSGLALTAWQPEDLPSALYAVCVDPNEPTSGLFEGDDAPLVGELVRRFSVGEHLTAAERSAVLRVRAAGELWMSTSPRTPAPWSDAPEGQSS